MIYEFLILSLLSGLIAEVQEFKKDTVRSTIWTVVAIAWAVGFILTGVTP